MNALAKSVSRTGFRTVRRCFARNIKKPETKLINLEEIRITDKSTIYPEELESERDFFYQEMLEKTDEQEMLRFYAEREDKFDALGIKLLVVKLFENRYHKGQKPLTKIRRMYFRANTLVEFKVIQDLLESKCELIGKDLTLSHMLELIEEVSKHSLRCTQFDKLVFQKFMVEKFLIPSQFVYDILLGSVNVDCPAYKLLLKRFEEDLVNKRFEVTDIVIALALLESVLASKKEEMRIIRILEFYIQKMSDKTLFYLDAFHLFEIYSKYNFKAPNLDLVDVLSAALVKNMHLLPLSMVEELLRHTSNIGINDLNLLAAVNRRVFNTLSYKMVNSGNDLKMLELDEQVPNEENLKLSEQQILEESDKIKQEALMTDEEILANLKLSIFGDLTDWDGNPETLFKQKPAVVKDKVLSNEIKKLPEILYHLCRLNVVFI